MIHELDRWPVSYVEVASLAMEPSRSRFFIFFKTSSGSAKKTAEGVGGRSRVFNRALQMHFSLAKRQGTEIPIIELKNIEYVVGNGGGNTVGVLKKLEGCLALVIQGTNFSIEDAGLGRQLSDGFNDAGKSVV